MVILKYVNNAPVQSAPAACFTDAYDMVDKADESVPLRFHAQSNPRTYISQEIQGNP